MKYRVIVVLFIGFSIVCSGSKGWFYASWFLDNQEPYDLQLHRNLRDIGGYGLRLDNLSDFYSCYPKGEEMSYARADRAPWAYNYYVQHVDKDGMIIKAENVMGGRSYIFDAEWYVTHYIFLSDTEAREIGKHIIRWLTIDDLTKNEEQQLLLALGWRGLYTQTEQKDLAKHDILGCVGDFVVYDELREKIWKAIRGGKIFEDDIGRAICVRSMLSKYEDYPDNIKKEVLILADEFSKDIIVENENHLTVYSSDIKAFCHYMKEKGKEETSPRQKQNSKIMVD